MPVEFLFGHDPAFLGIPNPASHLLPDVDVVLDVFEGNRVRQTVEQLSDLFLGSGLVGRIHLHEEILAGSGARLLLYGSPTDEVRAALAPSTRSSWRPRRGSAGRG